MVTQSKFHSLHNNLVALFFKNLPNCVEILLMKQNSLTGYVCIFIRTYVGFLLGAGITVSFVTKFFMPLYYSTTLGHVFRATWFALLCSIQRISLFHKHFTTCASLLLQLPPCSYFTLYQTFLHLRVLCFVAHFVSRVSLASYNYRILQCISFFRKNLSRYPYTIPTDFAFYFVPVAFIISCHRVTLLLRFIYSKPATRFIQCVLQGVYSYNSVCYKMRYT